MLSERVLVSTVSLGLSLLLYIGLEMYSVLSMLFEDLILLSGFLFNLHGKIELTLRYLDHIAAKSLH